MRALSSGIAAALCIAASLAGCGAEELNAGGNVVCEEIGRTIANVSWACGLSLEAANARGRGFVAAYECGGPVTNLGEYKLEVGLQCPVSMAQMPCDVATAAGDDYSKWVAAVPACHDIATPMHAGGGS